MNQKKEKINYSHRSRSSRVNQTRTDIDQSFCNYQQKKAKAKSVSKEIRSKLEKNISKVKLSNSKFAIRRINYDIVCKRFESKWKTSTVMHVNNAVCKWMLKNNIIWKKRDEHENSNSRDANLSLDIKEIEKVKKQRRDLTWTSTIKISKQFELSHWLFFLW